MVLVRVCGLELPASLTSAAASTPSASTITTERDGDEAFSSWALPARRARAAAPQRRHHSCAGCSGAPHSGHGFAGFAARPRVACRRRSIARCRWRDGGRAHDAGGGGRRISGSSRPPPRGRGRRRAEQGLRRGRAAPASERSSVRSCAAGEATRPRRARCRRRGGRPRRRARAQRARARAPGGRAARGHGSLRRRARLRRCAGRGGRGCGDADR